MRNVISFRFCLVFWPGACAPLRIHSLIFARRRLCGNARARTRFGLPRIKRSPFRCVTSRLRDELLSRFRSFVNSRSRHSEVLLEEIVSAYMRADAARNAPRCSVPLKALGWLSLESSYSIASRVDLDDLVGVLGNASKMDGRMADSLITEAFKRKIESDPATAFRFI